MKLALLGVDRWVQLAAESASRSPDCTVSVLCDTSEQILAMHPAASVVPWEDLLLGREFDIVIVSSSFKDDVQRTELLRRLVQESVPALLIQPAAEAIVLHELGMIQHDTSSILAVWNPVLGHPAVSKIAQAFPEAESAGASQVTFKRSIGTSGWDEVLPHLARDAQWIRHLIGPPDRATALATANEQDALKNLSVTFVGPVGAMAQWSLAGPAEEDSIVAEFASGRAVWHVNREGGCGLALEGTDSSETTSWTAEEVHKYWGDGLLSAAERILNDGDESKTFDDATRAVELAEAAFESNRRNRTIPLHYEEHSEQQTFKSVMAAGGCLLLLGILFLLGVSIAIDSIGAPVRNSPWWRIWPAYLLAPVVLFLLLQTLWRVFASPKG